MHSSYALSSDDFAVVRGDDETPGLDALWPGGWRPDDRLGVVMANPMDGAGCSNLICATTTLFYDHLRETRGTGNFFRPQVSDILFQHDNGAVAIWEMNEARVLTYGYVDNPGLGWHVLGVCDCNQDGRLGDILLQNDNGDVMIWEMTGTSYVRKSLGNPGAGLHL